MASSNVACFVLLSSLVAAVLGAPKDCMKNQENCIHNNDCCGGCCSERKCVAHADACSKNLNPCSLHYCPSGKTCYLQQVACVSANCDPIPACKDPDYDY